MFGRLIGSFVLGTAMEAVRRDAIKRKIESGKQVVQDKLGFDTIDEFMKATPEEVLARQKAI